jgi:hypothetical protein
VGERTSGKAFVAKTLILMPRFSELSNKVSGLEGCRLFLPDAHKSLSQVWLRRGYRACGLVIRCRFIRQLVSVVVLLKDNLKLAAVLRLATISFSFNSTNLSFKKLSQSVSKHLKTDSGGPGEVRACKSLSDL